MTTLKNLSPYSDDKGNKIDCDSVTQSGVTVNFLGSNNHLSIEPGARIRNTTFQFDCDNGRVEIGKSDKGHFISVYIRVGQDSKVEIGEDVSTTTLCLISAVEGTSVSIGNDVMIASLNEIRSDDAHPIFDVATGTRINPAKDITIGNHVWLARSAVVFGGAIIGDGSVIGYGSLVKGPIPNNCVAAGTPARVMRRDIAWERPHLSMSEPFYKPDAEAIEKSEYWAPTYPPLPPVITEVAEPKLPFEVRALKAVRWRIARLRKAVKIN